MAQILNNPLILSIAKSNEIFHYTRCITPKRVTSWRIPSSFHCAWATQFLSKKLSGGGESLAMATLVSDLSGTRFEPPNSRSKGERVTFRPSGQFLSAVLF